MARTRAAARRRQPVLCSRSVRLATAMLAADSSPKGGTAASASEARALQTTGRAVRRVPSMK